MNKIFLDQLEPFITLLTEQPINYVRECIIRAELNKYDGNTILRALIVEREIKKLRNLLASLKIYNKDYKVNTSQLRDIIRDGDNLEVFEIVYEYSHQNNNIISDLLKMIKDSYPTIRPSIKAYLEKAIRSSK